MNLKKQFPALVATIFVSLGCISCDKNDNGGGDTPPMVENPKIAVVADLHYFDLSLLENKGTAFERYIAGDRKLIEESTAITEAVVSNLIAEKPDVVIVCGDMTKDGERLSHEGVIAQLARLRAAGAKVLVTPGNHDINNPHAYIFDGENTRQTATVTPDEFRTMYADFGFGEAIATGPDLCYVSEPAKDLWIISIDACEYKSNTSGPVTKGSIDAAKLAWLLERTAEGTAAGKTILGIMHHGMVEHYDSQKTLFGEYVIDDWDNISTRLADAGMKVVFTGHYHAQDIRKKETPDGGFIFDVETGSTVTAPCPYRIINMTDGQMSIVSKFVESIDFEGVPAGGFRAYAADFLATGMLTVAKGMLMSPPYSIDEATANMAAPLFSETFVTHYAGDEKQADMSATSQQILAGLGAMAGANPLFAMIGGAVQAIWNDPAPADNKVIIDLETGTVK